MRRLTINLATRGRPSLLIDTIERTLANIRSPHTRLVVSIDLDDYETRDALADIPPLAIEVCARLREDSLGAKYNRCLKVARADVYLMMVDYAPHVTPGFDKEILEAASIFPDGIGVVYNDMANLSFPGINAVTHKLVEKMGGIYPEYFPVWFIDHWLDDIARMIGRIVYCPVQIDTSKRPGTQNRRDIPFWCEFYMRMVRHRELIAADIIGGGDFLIPEWQKQQFLRNFPLVRQRSEMINGMVQMLTGKFDTAEDTPQHQRLRAKAVAMLQDQAA